MRGINFLLVCLLQSFTPCLYAGHNQTRLFDDILFRNGYPINPLERPVSAGNATVLVNMTFNVQRIISLNVKQQYLESLIWVELYWFDSRLTWQPEQYGGIEKIRLPHQSVWLPDVLMYNSADRHFDGSWPVNLIVKHNGLVSYFPPSILKSSCKMDVKWSSPDGIGSLIHTTFFKFTIEPYEQCCMLKFGSWTHDVNEVNITSGLVKLQDYLPNGEFLVTAVKTKRYDYQFSYAHGEENYPYVVLCFHLRRMGLYYVFNLMAPALLVMCMSVLVFMLPVQSGEKISLSILTLLTLGVFSIVLAESLPRTSDSTPLLGVYFTINNFFCSFAVAFSVFVLNLQYFRGLSHCPPKCVRYGICYYLAKLLFMRIPEELQVHCSVLTSTNRYPSDDATRSSNSPNASERRCSVVNNSISSADAAMVTSAQKGEVDCQQTVGGDSFRQMCVIRMCSIFRELRTLIGRIEHNKRREKITREWCFAASVIDRACFCLFIITTSTCAVFMLFWRPHSIFQAHKDDDCPCDIKEESEGSEMIIHS